MNTEIYAKSAQESMTKILLLLTIITLFSGCSFSKKPQLKYIDNLEVKNVSLRDITLHADAVFDNLNYLGGTLSIEDVQVFVDNIAVGTISAREFEVPAKDEFSIPLQGTFSLSKIYEQHKQSLLGSVLKVIQTDSLQIEYKGVLRYHLGNFSYPYEIEKTQKIAVSK